MVTPDWQARSATFGPKATCLIQAKGQGISRFAVSERVEFAALMLMAVGQVLPQDEGKDSLRPSVATLRQRHCSL